MNPANPADATSCTARGHGSSLAHVPAGQLLRDVEGLPDIRVVEVGGGGGGVGAGGIQADLVPRAQQQCLGARAQGEGLYSSATPTPWGKPMPLHT